MNQFKQLLTIACLLIGTTFMYGQSDCDKNSAYICEDFESYDVTMPLGPQSDDWSTWSGNEGGAEDGVVSTAYAKSGSQSMKIQGTAGGGGPQDVILWLDDQTTGRYRIRFDIYIPAGAGAYYNIQHDFDGANSIFEWASQITFFPSGIAQLDAGMAGDALTSYNHDEWLRVDQIIDMDADTTSISLAGKYLHSWRFSNEAVSPNTGLNQMAAIDFFPIDPTHHFYIDDVFVEQLPDCSIDPSAIICDDMEAYTADEAVGPQSSFWSTWSIADGGAEDATVSTAYAASGSNSILIGNNGSVDATVHLGNRTTGVYQTQFMLYIPSGADGYFNLHSDENYVQGSTFWLAEFYFGYQGTNDTPGMGSTTLDASTFAFPHDTWFVVRTDVDLDLNTLNFWVDGVQVYTDFGIADNNLGMIDFFSASGTMEMYVDNLLFKQLSVSEIACASISVGASSGPSSVCWGDGVSIGVGPSVVPNYNEADTLSGFAWAISTSDISGSTDPFVEPDFLGTSVGFFPTEVYDLTYINDGVAFPVGTYFFTPVTFGSAINTDGTIAGIDFSSGCVETGTSVEVEFLDDVPDITATGSATGSTGSDGTATIDASGSSGTYVYEWDNGGSTAEITGLAPGDYTCTVTGIDANGCSSDPEVVTVTVDMLEGVEGIDILESLTISPNPTRGNVLVDLNLSEAALVQLEIISVTGKVLAQFDPQNTSSYQNNIDLSHLANGLYFAKITVGDNAVVKKINLMK